MWAPLAVLALLSLGGGYVLANHDLLQNWLAPVSQAQYLSGGGEPEGLPLGWISVGAAVLGIAVGILYYRKGLPKSEGFDDSKWSHLRLLARRQFGFDHGLNEAAIDGGGLLANGLWHGVEVHVVDGLVNGIAGIAAILGKDLSQVTKGYVRAYALVMLLGGVAILGIMFLAGAR
jgi:NADH-quinone oxidoreductase subunit L